MKDEEYINCSIFKCTITRIDPGGASKTSGGDNFISLEDLMEHMKGSYEWLNRGKIGPKIIEE